MQTKTIYCKKKKKKKYVWVEGVLCVGGKEYYV